jgi:hypothetical protein
VKTETQGRYLGAFNPELEEADPLRLEELGVRLRVWLRAQVPEANVTHPPRPPRQYHQDTKHRS